MKRNGERFLKEDEIVSLPFDETTHIVSENHFYKSEGYYALVKNEASGVKTLPRSSDVIDAYVVPICLEKAKLEGISVCDWEISYSYAKPPCIVYGLNYYSTPDQFVVASDQEQVRQTVKHVTNSGRYPFCYQALRDGEKPQKATAVFGELAKQKDEKLAALAKKVYEVFSIPLVTILYVQRDGAPHLSSLGPVKYSKLTKPERAMLGKYLNAKWQPVEGGHLV
ncbi:MAG: RimK-like ATPgrasp N-terminal domain-containing protein [Methanomassiliicoccales archaeon]|nr:RimK-like ATPgrasp N-terminal domain-containing protein [Methanomassiliicoccales archaeon]